MTMDTDGKSPKHRLSNMVIGSWQPNLKQEGITGRREYTPYNLAIAWPQPGCSLAATAGTAGTAGTKKIGAPMA